MRVSDGKAGRGGLSRLWKRTLKIAGTNMMIAFAGQWLLWGGISPFLLPLPDSLHFS